MIDIEEYLTAVAERGDYTTRREAEQTTLRVLDALGQRLFHPDATALAKHLPDPLGDVVIQGNEGPLEALSAEGFLARVARRLPGASSETARWDASAVLCTTADQLPADTLADLLDQLGDDYAVLFGQPGQKDRPRQTGQTSNPAGPLTGRMGDEPAPGLAT